MFQVTSSETMKCPSKEIDKNNISLLLSNHKWFISLFESPHSSCFVSSGCPVVFLQSMAVSCVSCWRVRGEAGGRGTLRSVLAPPSTSTPVLFGSVGLRGCSLSLFLSDSGAATCVLLHLDPPPALPWESVLRPRSRVPPRKEKQPSAAPCSPLGQCGRSRVSIPVERGGAAESLVYLGQHQMRIYSRHPGPTGALDQQGRRGLSPPSG